LIDCNEATDISRQSAGNVIGINLDSGDRFVRGKWKECLEEIEKESYTIGFVADGKDLHVMVDGYMKTTLVNNIKNSELEGDWYAF
jgi:hypothetical protein